MTLPQDIIALSIEEVWAARGRLFESLTRGERDDFEGLRYGKRRRDWLAGRLAAKRAIQRMSGLPFSRVEVRAEQDGPTSGRPAAWIGGRRVGYLSISHSGDLAIATWCNEAVGIDAELVEERDDSFAELAFNPEELRRIDLAPNRNIAMTRAWCEKEAYAKYLGVGFRRSFSDLIVPSGLSRATGDLMHRGRPMCWALVSTESP